MHGYISLIGGIVFFLGCGLFLFFACERREDEERARQPQPQPALPAARFFTDTKVKAPEAIELDPATVMLVMSLLERHVRQERAAVENFLEVPSVAHLRTGASSPFVN